MGELTKIDIDIDVYKAIENARQSFSETPNDVLRRIIGLDHNSFVSNEVIVGDELVERLEIPTGRAWRGKGVELPHGTHVRMEHNGRTYSGEIVDGEWHTEGVVATTPSGAASAITKTKSGSSSLLNGWNYWEIRLPTSNRWRPIASLRK